MSAVMPTSQSDTAPARHALLSVSDKQGLVEFARTLHGLGFILLSTGGTAQALELAGLPVRQVAEHTGFPEMLDGRVKTLHPHIHGGLLARRTDSKHQSALAEHGIAPIDLLVVNLYPFQQATRDPACSFANAIENIDIGGPAMVRAAAKNHADVAVVVDPADYDRVAEALTTQAELPAGLKLSLAQKAYAHTAAYDAAVANWLSSLSEPEAAIANPDAAPSRNPFPTVLSVQWQLAMNLRYGENPQQSAAFYRDTDAPVGLLAQFEQLQGKALSFNNLADADAAWECVRSFPTGACVIVKHANPCGVALGLTPLTAYHHAYATDPTSAFGGILAFNAPVDEETAQAIGKQFAEVVIAPSYTPQALLHFAAKPNLRVLQVPLPTSLSANAYDAKRIGGGWLLQTPDNSQAADETLRCVSRVQPDANQLDDLRFAVQVAKFVKSNAIVYARNGRSLGIGAGQMSRIDAARIAAIKAEQAGLTLIDSVAASDAFFPFRDGLDALALQGARCVAQPGGSVRDDEVIAAADEHGIALVFTGVRHFRH